jgi:hypothetical protein
MHFDAIVITFVCLLVAGPVMAFKLLDRFVNWVERKQFERLVDRVGESGR